MNFIKILYKSLMNGPILVILFGLVFFGVGAGLTYRQHVLENQELQTQGTVIGLTENCDDDGCAYSPKVRFTSQDGSVYTFESMYSSSPPEYNVGEQVSVIYSPESPWNAVIEGEGQLFRIIFMGVGGIIITGGLFFFAKNFGSAYFEQST